MIRVVRLLPVLIPVVTRIPRNPSVRARIVGLLAAATALRGPRAERVSVTPSR